jgi:hypothetical protein
MVDKALLFSCHLSVRYMHLYSLPCRYEWQIQITSGSKAKSYFNVAIAPARVEMTRCSALNIKVSFYMSGSTFQTEASEPNVGNNQTDWN